MSAFLGEILFHKIPQTSEQLNDGTAHLSESEKLEFRKLNTPKRKQEWLGGRLVSKKVVEKLLRRLGQSPPELNQIVLAPSDGNPPQVSVAGVHISLSHSHELACAMAYWSGVHSIRIGIDLEKIKPIDPTILNVAFTPVEQSWISNENWRLYQFWTAKEALLKACGLGLTVDLKELQVLAPNSTGPLNLEFRRTTYEVMWNRTEDYLWSWCRLDL